MFWSLTREKNEKNKKKNDRSDCEIRFEFFVQAKNTLSKNKKNKKNKPGNHTEHFSDDCDFFYNFNFDFNF